MGWIAKQLSKVFSPKAAKIVESAVITGAVSALGVVSANVTDLVNVDLSQGVKLVLVTVISKVLQKIASDLQSKTTDISL